MRKANDWRHESGGASRSRPTARLLKQISFDLTSACRTSDNTREWMFGVSHRGGSGEKVNMVGERESESLMRLWAKTTFIRVRVNST